VLTLPGGTLKVAHGMTTGMTNGAALAMIRPESIRIVAAENAALQGQVDSVSFVGDRQRASIGGAANRPLMADVPNTIAIKIGDRVGLSIDPAAIRLLPGESA
jgi:putative spermidine/putrescine transport system ATP-binding protein